MIRQNFSPPCAFIRDLTSGKSSSAKRTSGESEVFDPRADSNRLCFKTIRLSLGVLDMSGRSSDFFICKIEKMDTIIKRENCLEDSKLGKQVVMCSCVCWPRGAKYNLNHVQEIQITFISN